MTDAAPPFSPPTIYRAHLIECEGCWLDVRCACGTITLYPFQLLIRKLGRSRQLGEIASRIRCKRCRERPATVHLNETHNREPCHGTPPGWSVQLFPPLA